MKSKLLHFFAVFMAMFMAIPIANAAPEDYKLTVNTTPVSSGGSHWYNVLWNINLYTSQIAGSNGVIYGIMPGTSRLSYLNSTTNSDGSHKFDYSTGMGIAKDDNGNIILANVTPTTKITSVKVFAKSSSWGSLVSSTESRTISLSAYTGAGTSERTDYFSASGNLLNGEGFLWFTDGGTVVRLTVASNGTVTEQKFTVPSPYASTGRNTQSYFYAADNGKYILQNTTGIFQCTISGTTLSVDKELYDDRGIGSDIITFREHTLLARNNKLGTDLFNASAKIKKFDVVDLTQNATLASGLLGGESTYATVDGVVDVYCNFEKKDDNTVYLYTLAPNVGMKTYKITATSNFITNQKAALVSNTDNVKITWTAPSYTAPSKYRVHYSTDGGSNWTLAANNITGTEYTVQNLTKASTYVFKVQPYYTASAKWGHSVKTGSVAIPDYTNPVQNLNATLVDGINGDVNVTWSAPSAGSASKYSICYSTDGGSTWSTAIETNNLSYSYSGLTTGSYLFKVTPYYSNAWGEATTSNSVNVINAAGAPISNLAYQYVLNSTGRQDIKLTWEAPTGMVNTSVTGYKVYRGSTLLATLGADVLTYTHEGVKENYTYKVVPLFDGLGENSSYGLSVTPTEVTVTFVAPEITEIRNYAGYSLTELFYKMPAYAPYKPLYYNLYRDGKLIQGKLQAYNTLDESLVRSSETTTVNYQIEAVYGSAADTYPAIDSVKSNLYPVTIAPRDWARTGFILQEVYNVPIDEIAADKKPNLFDNNNYYRQGQFNTFDKKWYIAQRADNLSKHDETGKDGQITSTVEGTTGGIVTIKAENADDVKNGVEKIFTKPGFENVGIAMDDAGTIFVRNNNKQKLSDTNQDGFTIPTGDWFADAFERRITEGTFYKRNADGTYSEVTDKLDLTALWTQDDWIEKMYYTGTGSNLAEAGTNSNFGQVIGRTDNYNMYGDVMSAEGGYLILSPSWTRTAFKVKIANGAYVSHEVIEFNRYENTGYLLEPKTGTENYGFHLDGRDAVTVQIRSNGYYGVHEWNQEGTSGWHPIFTADSRVNNAGGTSIQAFGKKITQTDVDADPDKYTTSDIGRHTGELFIITPQSMHSHNVGDFLISRATKTNTTDFADEGSLMPSTPVAMKVQTDARSNSTATNANGNWFHAEVGTYASAMKDDDECVDIYQYVPGTRFARYRLIQSNQFPQVQPTLNITTAYNDDNTEITHFDGVAIWKRPEGFGRSTGSANAKVKSYIVELYNSKNELVATDEVDEIYNEDGTPVDDEYVYNFDYKAKTDKDDIDFGRYSVSVRVKYQTLDGTFHISDPLFAEDIHDYPADPAKNLSVYTYKNSNATIEEWVEKENGEWVVETKPVDSYRIELNFDAAGGDEPVSYYTVKAIRNKVVNGEKVTDEIEITDFELHMGEKVENGVIKANYIKTNQIPGDYDFGANKAPFYKVGDDYTVHTGGQSRQKSVLSWHHTVPVGTYSNAVAAADDSEVIMEPDQWEYVVVAHYAAKNRVIAKDAEAVVEKPNPGFIETGVEVIGEDASSSLQIYPIPASTEITIKSPEAINSIVVYNEAGVEVMSLAGNGETTTTVNIEDLATGYYFVKVNNQAPVKIIKK